MERTLISWNFPNMVTIPLMAAVGFIVFAAAWQLLRRTPLLNGGSDTSNQGGF